MSAGRTFSKMLMAKAQVQLAWTGPESSRTTPASHITLGCGRDAPRHTTTSLKMERHMVLTFSSSKAAHSYIVAGSGGLPLVDDDSGQVVHQTCALCQFWRAWVHPGAQSSSSGKATWCCNFCNPTVRPSCMTRTLPPMYHL